MSAELTKFSELFTAAAKDTFAPLQGRVQAWVDVVQTSTRRLSLARQIKA